MFWLFFALFAAGTVFLIWADDVSQTGDSRIQHPNPTA
jgi:hypothetical protein